MLSIRIDITKRLLLRMAMFLAVIATAVLFDVYVDNNPDELEDIQAESEKHNTSSDGVYLIAQTGLTTLKTAIPKWSQLKLQVQTHDKFLRKYHQIRNYEVLKEEVQSQTVPLIQSYSYLVYQNYFFTQPDEDSLG